MGSMLERPYIVAGDSVFILLLLFALSLLSVIVFQSRRQIVHNLRYFFRRERKYAERGVVTKNFWLNTAVLIFISAFTVSLSVFDELVHRSGFSPTLNVPYWVLVILVLLFSGFIYLKLYLYNVVNWTFFDIESSRHWTTSYLFITSLCSFPCYAIILLELYSDISPQIVLFCYAFLTFLYEILLIFKLFINFQIKKYGAFFIFLYLCSVELVPNILLWRFLQWASDVFIEANVLY